MTTTLKILAGLVFLGSGVQVVNGQYANGLSAFFAAVLIMAASIVVQKLGDIEMHLRKIAAPARNELPEPAPTIPVGDLSSSSNDEAVRAMRAALKK